MVKNFNDLDPSILYTVMRLSDQWFKIACPEWVEKIATKQCETCPCRLLCSTIDYYGSQANQTLEDKVGNNGTL